MDKNDDRRRQLIRDVLAATEAQGHDDVLARAMPAWERLAAHLSPLVGEAGFCALYLRALRLSAPDEHWHNAIPGTRSVQTLLAALRDSLGAIDAQDAKLANATLLDTFTKLLSGLIGEGLTTRLLNTAWTDRSEGKHNE
ncbi:MAG: hypothetical protein V4508_07060 [Pseudomonadota bacterium]